MARLPSLVERKFLSRLSVVAARESQRSCSTKRYGVAEGMNGFQILQGAEVTSNEVDRYNKKGGNEYEFFWEGRGVS